jgi:hypothetical protein
MNQWLQQGSEPLFPDVIWSRPVTKRGAGKLLIIGGQAQEFAHVAAAYSAAEKAGAGTIRVLMPDSTEKVTRMLPNIEYAPSNPSGSFSKAALAHFLDMSAWADQVLLAGDLGKNSETTTILDGYLLKCPCSVTISQNALASIHVPFAQLLQRPIILVLDFKGLQRLGMDLELDTPVQSTMGQPQLAEALKAMTPGRQASLICIQEKTAWVSTAGKVSSTKINGQGIVEASAVASVWAMQQPTKQFEALTSSFAA